MPGARCARKGCALGGLAATPHPAATGEEERLGGFPTSQLASREPARQRRAPSPRAAFALERVEGGCEVNRYAECGLYRWCFIVSPVSVLLGILSDFCAVNLSVYLCVLASSTCSRMGGPGPRSSDRVLLSCHLPGIIFTKRGGSLK